MCAVSHTNRLAGLIPVVADWHTKVKLLEVMVIYHIKYVRMCACIK